MYYVSFSITSFYQCLETIATPPKKDSRPEKGRAYLMVSHSCDQESIWKESRSHNTSFRLSWELSKQPSKGIEIPWKIVLNLGCFINLHDRIGLPKKSLNEKVRKRVPFSFLGRNPCGQDGLFFGGNLPLGAKQPEDKLSPSRKVKFPVLGV